MVLGKQDTECVTLRLVSAGFYDWVFLNRENKETAVKTMDPEAMPGHPEDSRRGSTLRDCGKIPSWNKRVPEGRGGRAPIMLISKVTTPALRDTPPISGNLYQEGSSRPQKKRLLRARHV